jgi:UDP-3-O-[3-hydroxymyristoyl] glucosamine N-acyltransferase
MAVLLGDLTRLCGGILRGDSTVAITGAATLFDVQAGEITFIDKPERLPQLLASPAAAAIVPQGVSVEGRPAIEVANVHEAFTAIVLHFRPQPKVERTGISPAAYVSPSAVLERDVDVHPGATIGERTVIGAGSSIGAGVHVGRDCRIGKNVTLHPGVVLYPGTVIGDHSVLHAGVDHRCRRLWV